MGNYNNNALGFLQTLVEHWNGSQWSIVPSPNALTGDNDVLNAVATASATDVWAVGYFTTGSASSPNRTLIEHWDGARWSVVPSPNSSSQRDVLNGVAVASAGNVWAVGYAGLPGAGQTALTEEWDGTRWSVVPSPRVGTDPMLAAVVAISPSNVWAVGQVSRPTGGTQVVETLTEQWNGTQWSPVPSPNVGSSENVLAAVDHVAGTNELWAAGFYANASSPFPTLVEHYC